MTTSRARLIRLTVPVAAALLALAACSSTSSEPASGTSDAMMSSAPSDAMMSDGAMSDEAMSDEAMSDEAMSSDAMSSDAMSSDAMSSDGAMASDGAMSEDAMMSDAGAFIDLAAYEADKGAYDAGTVVLFFNASWCPTCQEANRNLKDDPTAIPAGLTVVSVDYDNSDELKQKYGITTQHTFVQVDANGNELAKWTGSVTADQIAKQTV
ncbi:MAG: thioredoxin [Actinomycetales bacterium]|nr:thioredoxin [Actinomycetales bacterium]